MYILHSYENVFVWKYCIHFNPQNWSNLHGLKRVKPLAKSVSIPLGLTAPAPATDAAIYKKVFESGRPLDFV